MNTNLFLNWTFFCQKRKITTYSARFVITEKRRQFNTHVTSFIAVRIPKSIFIMKTGQDKFLPPANEVWGKVIFLHLSVILFTVGEGGLPQGMLGFAPPPEQTPHPGSRHPLEQTHPWSRHPPCSACWEIRSTSGRYASYWNAILLGIISH